MGQNSDPKYGAEEFSQNLHKSQRSKKYGKKDETKTDPEVSKYIYKRSQRRKQKRTYT